jgi:hypothetical protein
MNDQEAVQWINKNAPTEMRWWIHDRLRHLPSNKQFQQCPNCGGSEQAPNFCEICDPHGINYQQTDQASIPRKTARQWMLDNADAQESFAKIADKRNDKEQVKLRKDCAWAFRYVAEKARDAESASLP